MNGIRGQGTTEYLIILAVIIVIALVVVGIMGWVPGLGGGISEQQSKAYWAGATPWSIVDYKFTGTTGTIVVQNMTTDKLDFTAISFDGSAATMGANDYNVAGGSTQAIDLTNLSSCGSAGSRFNKTVSIIYDTANIAAKTQLGDKPLIGTCS